MSTSPTSKSSQAPGQVPERVSGQLPEHRAGQGSGQHPPREAAPVEDWSQAWFQARAREVRGLSREHPERYPGRRIAVVGRSRVRSAQAPRVRSCVLDERDRRQVPYRSAPVTLTARGRLVAAAALVILVLVVVGGGGLAVQRLVTGSPAEPPRTRQIQVLPGQTLWEIARRADPEADVRAMVDRIVELNGLSGAGELQVGDQLEVPVTERD